MQCLEKVEQTCERRSANAKCLSGAEKAANGIDTAARNVQQAIWASSWSLALIYQSGRVTLVFVIVNRAACAYFEVHRKSVPMNCRHRGRATGSACCGARRAKVAIVMTLLTGPLVASAGDAAADAPVKVATGVAVIVVVAVVNGEFVLVVV